MFRDFPTFSRICIFFLLTLLSSNLSLLSAASLLCFSSVHIVGSLTSKLPSTSSTRTRRAEAALGIYHKTFLIYRTCMRRAPARPLRACILRKWCPVSHVKFEAPLLTSHFSLHSSHSTLHTSHHTPHFTLHSSHSTLHTSHHTPHFTLHSSHSTLHFTLHILHSLDSTLHTSHFSLLFSHFALHTSHCTLHAPHFTLHSSHSTLHLS